MRYRKLDPTGDYQFGRNKNDFLVDVGAVAQAISTSLKLLEDEWWEDTQIGLPLFQNILGQPGTPENVQAVDLLVQGIISNVEGVRGIEDFESLYENRKYVLNCTVETIYGSVQVNEVIF
ncbi:hypothetical protein SAMN04487969_102492 [Paenibacillus algorifonticola]|uniref:Uncharacterized protein n=1 Tax=Paenibacillus algorifonticola TaxID=684063 RepID=A0A1I2AH83_9BACL|nr:hypothetical protein [Paenibacillus algorifonticola]SFE43276.1 hypothetical protein SAMN04487969_102492 [Paenibacillus algorifonticola]